MFKAHVFVSEDTDVAAELDKIDALARRHNLDDVKIVNLMRNFENVLADLKKQDAETAAYGIQVAIKKSIKTDDYDIVLELRSRKASSGKSGPLSWLLGK